MNCSFSLAKEIIITSVMKTSVENLTKIEAISSEPKLSWCNGILFNVYGFSNKEIELKELEGIHYFSQLHYAECKEKIDVSKWSGYAVEVIDQTGHTTFEGLTKAILNNEVKTK